MSSESINIDDFLRGFGFSNPTDHAFGRELLERESFTRAGRQNMARAKIPQAEFMLQRYCARCCGNARCQEHLLRAKDNRRVVVVDRAFCEVCSGSQIGRAVLDMAEAMQKARLTRLLVIGGTPNQHDDLRKHLPPFIQCEMVDGTGRVNLNTARTHINRNDLMIIWAPTPLAHKVSQVYERQEYRHKTIKVHRRGLAALAEGVIEHLRRREPGAYDN